jgi:ATP/maltotriose-dependent transcriptional regulator MalT
MDWPEEVGDLGLAAALADLAGGQLPSLALEMLMTAVDAAHFAGEPGRILEIARRAEQIPIPDDDHARFASCYLRGMASVLEGDMARGVLLLDEANALAEEFDDPIHLLYAAATGLYSGRGDTEQHVPRAVARARALSAISDLPHALLYAALGAATAGDLAQAGPQASEGLQIARETGQHTLACGLLAALAKVAALRGDEDECRARAQESLRVAVPRRLGLAIALATEALGLLDLGAGRPDEALGRFQAIATAEPGAGHPFVAMTTASYLVEAAVRSDHRDVAARASAAFSATAAHAAAGQQAIAAYCLGTSGGQQSGAFRGYRRR